jgi:hypothetical protein
MEAIITLVALHTYEGAGTIYLGPVGNRLYCDRGNGLIYSEDTRPFAAFPVGKYESGEIRCGDWMRVTEYRDDGTTRTFVVQALDAGTFGEHTKIGGLPIVMDGPPFYVSWPLYPGFARVTVTNMSAVARRLLEPG